jgi:hypothetical protein
MTVAGMTVAGMTVAGMTVAGTGLCGGSVRGRMGPGADGGAGVVERAGGHPARLGGRPRAGRSDTGAAGQPALPRAPRSSIGKRCHSPLSCSGRITVGGGSMSTTGTSRG